MPPQKNWRRCLSSALFGIGAHREAEAETVNRRQQIMGFLHLRAEVVVMKGKSSPSMREPSIEPPKLSMAAKRV